jgi:hypothetical protein
VIHSVKMGGLSSWLAGSRSVLAGLKSFGADVRGCGRYSGITTSYYRGAQGAMLVYDICSRESFQHVETWVREHESHDHFHPMFMITTTIRWMLVYLGEPKTDRGDTCGSSMYVRCGLTHVFAPQVSRVMKYGGTDLEMVLVGNKVRRSLRPEGMRGIVSLFPGRASRGLAASDQDLSESRCLMRDQRLG